jgi:Protein kinase G tetratricopeptide repeat
MENDQINPSGSKQKDDSAPNSVPEVSVEQTGRHKVMQSVRNVLSGQEGLPTREDLLNASRELNLVMPYNYEAWRLHADLLLSALKQLETREIEPDENFRLLSVALREDDIRDAAETALRKCAVHADSAEKRIGIIDEANRIRRMTWL